MPNKMAQSPTIRECRQPRVQYCGAILPILSVLGYWAITFGHFPGPDVPPTTRAVWPMRPFEAGTGKFLPSRGARCAVGGVCNPLTPISAY